MEDIRTENTVMSDTYIKELQARNEARARKLIESMGQKWLLHPANRVTKESYKITKNYFESKWHAN